MIALEVIFFETMYFHFILVRGIGIIGGGALIAAAAATGSVGIAPLAVAGLGNQFLDEGTSISDTYFIMFTGALGIGGAGFVRVNCMTPFCRTSAGQCCLIVQTESGLQCPSSC